MKKSMLLLLLVIPFVASSQNNTFLTFNSNIEYAPIGVGFMFRDVDSKVGSFFQVKISEDFLFRETVDGTESERTEDTGFDMNEFFFTTGVFVAINEYIDLYVGAGILTGSYFQQYTAVFETSYPESLRTTYGYMLTDRWKKSTDGMTASPVFTYGVIFNANKFNFAIGYDVAFVKPENYPITLINKSSVARLSSFTFGIGYKL